MGSGNGNGKNNINSRTIKKIQQNLMTLILEIWRTDK